MVDEKKNPINLKNAIFLLPGLDSLDQDLVKSMKTKEMRYPQRGDGLMEDLSFYDTIKDKKKGKK